MYKLQKWHQPETLEEAYTDLFKNKSNTILGGCTFLRVGSKVINTGIDLSKLDLNYIKERDGAIEIGAMAPLRNIETHRLLTENFCGMIPRALKHIVGIQFRNSATVGASVYSRYGFSDLITALLVLDTDVELYKGGRMPLEEFLERTGEKDILTRIFIRKTDAKAAWDSLRNSFSDYAVLNVAVSETSGVWKIAVGARPMTARLARAASEMLSSSDLSENAVLNAASTVSQELTFGTNMRASAEYRRAMSSALVRRTIMEVQACR